MAARRGEIAALVQEDGMDSDLDEVTEDLTEQVTSGAKCDVYWLMAIRILHLADSQSLKTHKLQYIIGMTHGILVYVLTISLQLTITAFLMLAATRIENEYHADFLQSTNMKLTDAVEKMKSAVMNRIVLAVNDVPGTTSTITTVQKAGIISECNLQLSVRYEWIYVCMIFIWVLNMLIELKDVTKDVSAFWGIPRTQKGGSIYSEDREKVVSLTPGARLALITFGPGVRCFVAIVLLFAGCKVLLFRQSMMLVVLCSMSLGFVVNLDDLMMNALSGAATKKELDSLKFVYTKRNTHIHKYWIGGLSGMTHMILCIAFAAIYTYGFEWSVMAFRQTCWDYYGLFGGDGKEWPDLKPKTDMMTFSDMFGRMESELKRSLLYS